MYEEAGRARFTREDGDGNAEKESGSVSVATGERVGESSSPYDAYITEESFV